MKQFTCTNCGGHGIEEIAEGITATTEVEDVLDNGDGSIELVYGKGTYENGELDRFQCSSCGQSLEIDELHALVD